MFKLKGPHGNRPSHRSVLREGQPQRDPSHQPASTPIRSPLSVPTQKTLASRLTAPPSGPLHLRTLAEYDRIMAKFENLQDLSFLPDMRVIVRLDAHRLGYHWASFPDAEYPLGAAFSQGLRAAAVSILTSGIRVLFCFVHGDEISVAVDPQELANGRKKTKLVSGLSSAASVGLCTALGRGALFHAKVSELPTEDHVIEYLLWQRLVARRNTIARYLSIKLTESAAPKSEVERLLSKASEEERLAALASYGVNYGALTPYEQRGALLWWAPAESPSPIRIEGQPYGIAECVALPNDDLFVEGARQIIRGASVATEGEAPIFARSFPEREGIRKKGVSLPEEAADDDEPFAASLACDGNDPTQ